MIRVFAPSEVREAAARWGDSIAGKLSAEECRDLSDAELDRCLSECVGASMLPLAKQMRDLDLLTLDAATGGFVYLPVAP